MLYNRTAFRYTFAVIAILTTILNKYYQNTILMLIILKFYQ
jgi:hypothetical protein